MGSQSSNSLVRQYKASGGNGIMMSDIRMEMNSDLKNKGYTKSKGSA